MLRLAIHYQVELIVYGSNNKFLRRRKPLNQSEGALQCRHIEHCSHPITYIGAKSRLLPKNPYLQIHVDFFLSRLVSCVLRWRSKALTLVDQGIKLILAILKTLKRLK
jgi:hypothetical protein